MIPPELRRFAVSDIDLKTQAGTEKLLAGLNLFMEQVHSLFAGNLTIGDNVNGKFLTSSFTTLSTYVSGGDFNSFTFPWNSLTAPQAVVIGYLRKDNSTEILKNPTSVHWTMTSSTSLRIDFIAGLAASTKYNVTLLAI